MTRLLLSLAIMAIIGMATDISRLENRVCEVDMKIRYAVIDKELQPYVIEFDRVIQESGIDPEYGSLVVIQFRQLRQGLLGIAHGMNHNVTLIDINSREWFKLSVQDKRMVIFHEMAHDVFNLEHGSTLLMMPTKPQVLTKQYVDDCIRLLIKHLKNGR
jgi:hypothetical protein